MTNILPPTPYDDIGSVLMKCMKSSNLHNIPPPPFFLLLHHQNTGGGGGGGDGGFFLACEDFGRVFDSSFPACAFFKVEISSRTLNSTL